MAFIIILHGNHLEQRSFPKWTVYSKQKLAGQQQESSSTGSSSQISESSSSKDPAKSSSSPVPSLSCISASSEASAQGSASALASSIPISGFASALASAFVGSAASSLTVVVSTDCFSASSSASDSASSLKSIGYGSKDRLDRPAVIRTSGTRGFVKGHDPEVSKAPTRRSCFHDMTSYLYMSLWLGPRSHGKAERSSSSVHTSDSTWL